ncbi:hypothetical protein QFZ37_002320 [Chryseobacterium ginsenosidimutans]|uniref:hypothetical protein n=1 Tax=Chryseobacterium ginsenosidimutans TaxID=687846 RepID=UPI002782EC6D|nr:hypothetical protein [Chryseobacterium ginsenosidimutans]MDQ0593951.1 hypothetical protein [Chryseobacterium ginsenosidimutans]
MKILYFAFFVLLFSSCSKNIDENCFIVKEEKSVYIEEKPYTIKEILAEKPNYLEIISLKSFRTFKEDSIYVHDHKWENYEQRMKGKEIDLKDFKDKFFDDFMFFNNEKIGNVQYTLGRNNLGYWLLKIEKNKPSAYFLGLSFSHYYLNEIQTRPIIKDGFLQIEGSLVKIIKVPGLPGYDDYSSIDEGMLFKINLKDLTKDADNDGYNDIFEKCFGLNPNNKDSDEDGIIDFEDPNPMFKSEKNKFTDLYENLLPEYSERLDFKKRPYYFEVFKSDCDYFRQVNPKEYKVLFTSENEDQQTDYIKSTDVFNFGISKIKKNKMFPERFYIQKWGSSSSTDYAAEYKDGKWKLEVVGTIVV